MEKRKRIEYLDALKGFVILSVVLGHVVDGYIGSNRWQESNGVLTVIFNLIYSFHMPACFLLSGYFYRLAYVDQDGNLKRPKMLRHVADLGILYVVFCVLMWAMKLIMADSVNDGVAVSDILMIWTKPMPSYWYLYVLIGLYFVFSVDPVRKAKPEVLLTVLTAACVLSNWFGTGWFQIQRIMYYGVFFYCGIHKRENEDFFLMRGIPGVVLAAAGGLLCAVLTFMDLRIDTTPVLNLIAAMGISTGLWMLFEGLREKRFVLLRICGENMMEIYLTHIFIAAAVRMILNKLGLTNLVLSMLICFTASVALPILGSTVLKKLKIHSYIFKTYSTLAGNKR